MNDKQHCAVCGWLLDDEDSEVGCVKGSCSMRPVPDVPYDLERAIADGYVPADYYKRPDPKPAGEAAKAARWICEFLYPTEEASCPICKTRMFGTCEHLPQEAIEHVVDAALEAARQEGATLRVEVAEEVKLHCCLGTCPTCGAQTLNGACAHDYDHQKARADKAEARCVAIENAGHRDDCGGQDTAAGRCDCGWLQREGAAQYIVAVEKARDKAEGDIKRFNILLHREFDKVRQLREALLRYGAHDEGARGEPICDSLENGPDTCTCGLDAALKQSPGSALP